MDVEAALKYPMNDEEEWVETTLIGGGVIMAAWLIGFVGMFFGYIIGFFTFGIGLLVILPLVFLASMAVSAIIGGYVVEVMRRTIAGREDPPRFDNPDTLIKEGLYVIGIALAYHLPLLVIGGVGMVFVVGLFGATVAVGDSGGAAAGLGLVGTLVFFGLFVVMGIYLLVVAYVLPAAVGSYAINGRVGAAFSLDRLKQVALSSEYLIAWVLALAINVVASQVTQFLVFLVVGFFIQFYVVVVLARIVAQGYADALGDESSPRSSVEAVGDSPRPEND